MKEFGMKRLSKKSRLKGRWRGDSILESYDVRSSLTEVFLGKHVLKIFGKFTGEHQYQSAISLKLFCNFIEITLLHGCSSVDLLYIFRIPFPKNTSRGLLLYANNFKIKHHYVTHNHMLRFTGNLGIVEIV